ncbi:inositol monophosphatase, partial [Kosakonia sp. H7A]
DFKGATPARMDDKGPDARQLVAGNIKVSEALQKVIVNTGYAAEFDAKF